MPGVGEHVCLRLTSGLTLQGRVTLVSPAALWLTAPGVRHIVETDVVVGYSHHRLLRGACVRCGHSPQEVP